MTTTRVYRQGRSSQIQMRRSSQIQMAGWLLLCCFHHQPWFCKKCNRTLLFFLYVSVPSRGMILHELKLFCAHAPITYMDIDIFSVYSFRSLMCLCDITL